MRTRIVPVEATRLGNLHAIDANKDLLDELVLTLDAESEDATHLQRIARDLQTSNIPVAFPTETVYGLGADATRSEAVRGIYSAKQRPSDNPLIVHFASLRQIRELLQTSSSALHDDPIPAVYRPLIQRFWPGPLTILLPNPEQSKLAPEVTAGLSTFGARIPRHPIALALLHLADRPIAAPSANASTKPSPTAAEHVAFDLDGRIETVVDGGPCEVGVESTVVDGLCQPPLILRPGGITSEQIKSCAGWEDVQIGYKDIAEIGGQPRAPGMKYRHYSPKARVLLYQAGSSAPDLKTLASHATATQTIGIIRTASWILDDTGISRSSHQRSIVSRQNGCHEYNTRGFQGMLDRVGEEVLRRTASQQVLHHNGQAIKVLDIDLGRETADIARGIFAALRDLDRENVDAIFVEGVADADDNLAAAIMNRLKKAAAHTIG